MEIKLTIDATVGNEVDGMLLQRAVEEFLEGHFAAVPMDFKLTARKPKAKAKKAKKS